MAFTPTLPCLVVIHTPLPQYLERHLSAIQDDPSRAFLAGGCVTIADLLIITGACLPPPLLSPPTSNFHLPPPLLSSLTLQTCHRTRPAPGQCPLLLHAILALPCRMTLVRLRRSTSSISSPSQQYNLPRSNRKSLTFLSNTPILKP
jgi:hypothetical protein